MAAVTVVDESTRVPQVVQRRVRTLAMAFHGGGGGDYYPSDFYRSDEWEPHNVQAYGAGEQPDGAPFRGSPVGPGRLASAWCRQRRSLICVHAFACRQRVAAGALHAVRPDWAGQRRACVLSPPLVGLRVYP